MTTDGDTGNPMALVIFFLFLAVPIIEIAVFIQVGEQVGLWNTIGVVILTAFAGTYLLRQQGLETLRRVQETLNRGELPLQAVFDGLCLLVAGALLLTPGFVTDGLGFLLFFPPFRRAAAYTLGRYFQTRSTVHMSMGGAQGSGQAYSSSSSSGGRSSTGPSQGGDAACTGGTNTVIDGEFEEISDTDPETPAKGKELDINRP